jgi:hypothetical protein
MLNTYQLNAVRNLVRPIPPHLVTFSGIIKYNSEKLEVKEYLQDQLRPKITPRLDAHDMKHNFKQIKEHFKDQGENLAVKRAYVKDARKASPQAVINYINYITHNLSDKVLKAIEPRILDIKEKFKSGEWEKLDWVKYGLIDRDKLNRIDNLFSLHNVHYSLMSPMLIAYYPNLDHFRQGREVRTKLGKYLTQFKEEIQLNDLEIKSITEAHTARVQAQQGWEVRFIESTDGTGWVNIYGQGERFNSCMTNSKAVQVYAHEKSVLKLAYMLEGGSVIARAIVRTQNNWDDTGDASKGYIRVYPDPNGHAEGRFMLDTLKNLGYEKQTNLNGCLLTAIQHVDDDDVFMSPYIDYGNGGSQTADPENIDGKTYLVIGDGEYDLANTGGWTSNVETWNCDECGDEVDEDEIEYVEDADRHVCNDCLSNDYTYVYGRNGDQYYVHHDNAIYASDEYYDSNYLSENDIYPCEASDEYYHIDDLVNTSMGFIHESYAKRLDYEDSEGNNYAHEDDIYELSNGKLCHSNDAEELQEEINEADRERDDAERAEDQPSRPSDTDGTTLQGAIDENN